MDGKTLGIFLVVLCAAVFLPVSPVWFVLCAAVCGILLKQKEVGRG